MLTRTDLQALASMRLNDAALLLRAGCCSSAYYLAGYAVELALKACISKAFQPDTIPDKAFVNEIYTHSLETLLGAAGLKRQFNLDSKTDPSLAAAWGIASKWTESSRYALWDSFAASKSHRCNPRSKPRSLSMGEEALVESQILDSVSLVKALESQGDKPTAVVWHYFSDAGEGGF